MSPRRRFVSLLPVVVATALGFVEPSLAASRPDRITWGNEERSPSYSVELARPSHHPRALREDERLRFVHAGEGCPRYEVTVFEDGRVEYLGRGRVWVRGRRARALGRAEMAALSASVARLPVDQQYVRAWPAFQAMTAGPRQYVEIARAEHNNFMDLGPFVFAVFRPLTRRFAVTLGPRDHKRISRNYSNAWPEHHLAGKLDTAGWVDGRKAREEQRAEVLSRIDLP